MIENQGRSGILLLDKPTGLTSHTAMRKAQRYLGAKKAGHTGSLDPLATGMLPVCLGEASKFSRYWLEADKAYTVTLRLGIETDTGDADGQVIATHPCPVLSEAEIDACVQRWVGTYEQVPPAYAAVKYQGKPAYWWARQGKSIPLAARSVTIHAIHLEAVTPTGFSLSVSCSKGTYIRSLVTEIGAALGCGAHVEALRRTWVHPFVAYPMVDLETLAQDTEAMRWSRVYSLSEALGHIPVLQVDTSDVQRLYHGLSIPTAAMSTGVVRIESIHQGFVGIGECAAGQLRPARLMAYGVG